VRSSKLKLHLRTDERICCQAATAPIATPPIHSFDAVLLSRKAQDARAARRGTPTDTICDRLASRPLVLLLIAL